LSEERTDVVVALLALIYDVPFETIIAQSSLCPKIMNALMYTAGHKYAIDTLKQEAKTNFSEAFDLEKFSSKDLSGLVSVFYSSTPSVGRGLRDRLVKAFDSVPDILDAWPRQAMDMVFAENVGFASDLFGLIEKRNLKAKTYKCLSCHTLVTMKLLASGKASRCVACGSSYYEQTWRGLLQ